MKRPQKPPLKHPGASETFDFFNVYRDLRGTLTIAKKTLVFIQLSIHTKRFEIGLL